MKIKFLLGFVFMLTAFAMQAQYLGPNEAIALLNSEATALENGSTDVKDLTSATNLTTSSSTITGLAANSTSDISLVTLTTVVYPAVMFQTVKEIQLAGNTPTGIQNAESFFAGLTNDTNREDVVDAVFVYIKDLITI